MIQNEGLVEKKVLGSNGYAFVNLTEEEELKFNLGVPELFFANIGRIDSKKFLKYYCNKCNLSISVNTGITKIKLNAKTKFSCLNVQMFEACQ